jgi:hypothetical protein
MGVCFLVNAMFSVYRTDIAENELLTQAFQNQKPVLNSFLSVSAVPLKILSCFVEDSNPLAGRIAPARDTAGEQSRQLPASDYTISSSERGPLFVQGPVVDRVGGSLGLPYIAIPCTEAAHVPPGGPPGVGMLLVLLFLLSPRRSLPEGEGVAYSRC